MTALLVVGCFALLLLVVCCLTDQPAPDADDFDQPTHVRLLTDQEPRQ